MSLYFALPGALAYGLADFAGGLATRRAPVFVVTAVVQVAGLVALLPVVPLAGGSPVVRRRSAWGVLAAAGGTVGLLLYLRALAVGPMGVVAPLSAVVGAGLPAAGRAHRRGAARPGHAGGDRHRAGGDRPRDGGRHERAPAVGSAR